MKPLAIPFLSVSKPEFFWLEDACVLSVRKPLSPGHFLSLAPQLQVVLSLPHELLIPHVHLPHLHSKQFNRCNPNQTISSSALSSNSMTLGCPPHSSPQCLQTWVIWLTDVSCRWGDRSLHAILVIGTQLRGSSGSPHEVLITHAHFHCRVLLYKLGLYCLVVFHISCKPNSLSFCNLLIYHKLETAPFPSLRNCPNTVNDIIHLMYGPEGNS